MHGRWDRDSIRRFFFRIEPTAWMLTLASFASHRVPRCIPSLLLLLLLQGDYKALCKEAGIEPRSQKKPAPAPAPMQSPSNVAMAPAQSPGQFQPQQSPTNTAYGQAQPAVLTAASPMGAPLSQQQQQQQQQSQQGAPTGGFMRAASVPGGMPSQTPHPQQPQLLQQHSLATRR